MSVISTWEAVPSRLEQFWLYLAINAPKGLPKSELEHLFSPPSLGKSGDTEGGEAGGNIFNGVLGELKSLGFVEQVEKDDSVVPLLPPDEKKKPEQKRQWFFEELRRIVTTPDEAKEKKQDMVPLALAWIALQSPDQPIPFGVAKSVEIISAFPHNEKMFGLNTDASLRQCYFWARYLGLCTFSAGKGKEILVPDATAVVRSLLPAIFADTRQLPADDFLSRLGVLCPVLERGEARKIVLSQAAQPENFPGEDELAGSSSLAMLRLEIEGLISLDDQSDARKPCILDLCTHKRRFSHVRLEGKAYGNA